MKQNVEICSGCIARSTEVEAESLAMVKKAFLDQVVALLKENRSDVEWSVGTTSCMRFCPEGRLSIVVGGAMGMTRAASVEQVVRDILARTPQG